ncbi:uncharacterized protein LOC132314570 [Cornus florida]|uniref:uncharacterized protein LOC132314570 n=1 Tax=Cornus florida TaxID=4283 RepID=UPI0028996F5A|nr:uncharacterized protein LOC132314570 [Cornus florida]
MVVSSVPLEEEVVVVVAVVGGCCRWLICDLTLASSAWGKENVSEAVQILGMELVTKKVVFPRLGKVVSLSMWKEIVSSSGFGLSDEAPQTLLKSRSSESSPSNMMSHDHDLHDQRRPFETVVGDGTGGSKPMTMSPIYHYADASTTSTGAVARTVQPLHTTSTAISTHSPYKSPADMAATLGYAFTAAQWKELERQSTIYEYMSASVPLPPHLLSPNITGNISPYSHSSLLGGVSNFNLIFGDNKDLEPGRCRRTDGKKWRCSKDVAPRAKYCDRHMHRSKPRSRKHVEVAHIVPYNNNQDNKNILTTTTTTTTSATTNNNNNKKTRLNPTTPPLLPKPPMVHTKISPPQPQLQLLGSTIQPNDTPRFFDESLSASSSKESSRGLDWMLEGEMVRMGKCSIFNTSANAFQPVYSDELTYQNNEPLSLFPFPNFGKPGPSQRNNDSSLFLHPDPILSLQNKAQTDPPRAFIDAWSNDNSNTNTNNTNHYSVSSGNISPSALTLSMAMGAGNLTPFSLTLSNAMGAGNAVDKELGKIQMALGAPDLQHNYQIGGSVKQPQMSSWLNPLPWEASTPGGPLAEALPISLTIGGRSPASPYASNGDSIGIPATTVSSPSGILHRTMLSFSDSSGCNSPTLAPPSAPPEFINFQWLN